MKPNDAILSADERYRYVLSRHVSGLDAGDARICLWVLVNPSTATATADDHTIRKIAGYCRRWEFAHFRVVNLWAYRSKEIDMLPFLERQDIMSAVLVRDGIKTFPPTDLIGPDNDRHISEQAGLACEIIVAWGSRAKMPPSARTRIPHVLGLLRGNVTPYGHRIFCIGRTKDGDPLHPLTTPYSAPRLRFDE